MYVHKAIPILVTAVLLSACSSNKELSLLHDDDIYYSPAKEKKADLLAEKQRTRAFVEETPDTMDILTNKNVGSVEDFDYYNENVAQRVLQDTSGVANYYNTAYNAPRYYNRDRFGFNIGVGFANGPMGYGVNYGSMGWGASMGYGMGFGYGMGGYGWNPYGGYGWNPYGGYGGYHCPSIYGGGPVWAGGMSNGYFGPRPNVGGGTGTGGSPDTGIEYYRNTEARGQGPDRLRTSRSSYTDLGAIKPEPAKRPVFYSPETVRRSTSAISSRGNSGFMNFIRDASRGTSARPTGVSGQPGRSNSVRPSGSRSFGSGASSPSRSFSAPRGGGMRR